MTRTSAQSADTPLTEATLQQAARAFAWAWFRAAGIILGITIALFIVIWGVVAIVTNLAEAQHDAEQSRQTQIRQCLTDWGYDQIDPSTPGGQSVRNTIEERCEEQVADEAD